MGSATGLTGEQRAIRGVVHRFAVEEIRPAAREADGTEVFPEGAWDGLVDLDLTGLTVPEEYGGFDADRATYAVVNEEVAYGQLAIATALSVHCLATECIVEFATDQQKETWLPEMVHGRPVGMFGLSEPDAGSNPAEMSTVARRKGDRYIVNGKKQWITNGQRGGVCILFAKTNPDGLSSVTQFLVPEPAGYEVGKKEEKFDLRASNTAALLLDDVRIPTENRLTEEDKDLPAAFHILTDGHIGIASQAVGLTQAAPSDAIDYANEREQFDKPISKIQTVRHRVADVGTQIHASRMPVHEAVRVADADDGPRTAASITRYFANEAAVNVANEAAQVRGGYSCTIDFDVERYYRDSKITTIYEGTNGIQKEIITRSLLD